MILARDIMRIIAGEFRGRKLLAPEGDVTRPITDRAKQSLFDVLSPYIEGANVFDLFAGTGSMGLECLSRGAKHATFFEADRSALMRLKKNTAALGVAGRARVISQDLFRWFSAASPPVEGAGEIDLLFLDPPYRFLRERPEDLRGLAGKLHAELAADGIIIFRHDAADTLELPSLAPFDRRDYGQMTIELLSRLSEQR